MSKRAILLVAALTIASVATAEAETAAALQSVIDGARQEGQLSIVVGEGTLGGWNPGRAAGFKKCSGLNLDVRFPPGPPMPNMVAAVIQQYQAHKPAVTD